MFSKFVVVLLASKLSVGNAVRRDFKSGVSSSFIENAVDHIGALIHQHMADSSSIVEGLAKVRSIVAETPHGDNPSVTQSLKSEVEDLIKIMQTEVDAKIRSAHQSDDGILLSSINELTGKAAALVSAHNQAAVAKNSLVACRTSQTSLSSEVEQHEEKLSDAQKKEDKECKEVVAVDFSWSDNATDFKVDCDISQTGNCKTQVSDLKLRINEMRSTLKASLEKARADHADQVLECQNAKSSADKFKAELETAQRAFKTLKGQCDESEGQFDALLCTFNSHYTDKCEEALSFKKTVVDIDGDAKDRKDEWASSVITQCVLQGVIDQDSNLDLVSQCAGQVDYTKDVGELTRHSDALAILMTGVNFKCTDAETVTFDDQTFTLPLPNDQC